MKSKMTLPPIDKSWYFGFLSATALYLIVFGIYSLMQPAKNYHALHLIDKSIKHANEIIDDRTHSTIRKMKSELDEQPHLKSITKVAESAQIEIKELLDNLNELRVRITEESGGLYSLESNKKKWSNYGYKKLVLTTDPAKDGTAVSPDNKNIVQRILIGEKEGEILKTDIIKTRVALLTIVQRLIDSLDKEPLEGIKFDNQQFEFFTKELSLKLPKNNKTFNELTFGNLSVAAANLMLRKFESDTKAALSQVIDYLASNIPRKRDTYDRLEILSLSSKPVIYLGDTFESKIGLGFISRKYEFSLNINGRTLSVDDFVGTYRIKPNSVGIQRYIATINVKNPLTGMTERAIKEFQFEVLAPKQK